MFWPEFDITKAIKTAKRYGVISFDIFDTLIKRDVSAPTLIFDVVERRYNRRHPEVPIGGFRKPRTEVERSVRENNASREVTLDEIYERLGQNKEYADAKRLFELKRIEIEVELDYCEPNIPVMELYYQCLSEGKRVIIVSDMYLPKAVIEQMLVKCGITRYERLYLSSDIGKQKKTGQLYDYVIGELGVKPSDILHFGDRKKADNLIPRIKGIGSFYVDPVMRNTAFISGETIKNGRTPLFPFINNRLPLYQDKGEMFRWGYEALGPLLLGFTTWVHEQITDKKIEKAYFLARDMNIVIQVYRKIYGDEGTAYLEVSRASLRKEYVVRKNDLSSVFDTMGRREYTARKLLEELQIDDTEAERICNASGIVPEEVLLPKTNLMQQFPAFNRCVLELLKEQDDHIADYLDSFGMFQSGNHALIDIGWHGTIQNMLETITGSKFEGLYFGNTKRNNFPDMSISGYWFTEKREKDALPYVSMITILEVMLFNQIGTVLGYEEKDEKTVPIYGDCEMKDFSMIEAFQNGALTFVDDYLRFEYPDGVLPAEEAVMAYRKMAFYPTADQARTFSELIYEDGKLSKLADARRLPFYCLHPKRLIKDYRSALWKEGFIKQVLPFARDPYRIDMAIKGMMRKSGIKKS